MRAFSLAELLFRAFPQGRIGSGKKEVKNFRSIHVISGQELSAA